MQPVLIYKDEKRISDEKAYLEKVIAYLQDLYNGFKNVSIEITLSELTSLGRKANNTSQQSKEKQIQNFVSEYLINKAGEPNFNGVKISREKLKEMVEMPDLTNVNAIVDGSWQWMLDGYAIVDEWLKLENDIINKSDTAYNKIEALYTHYTKNDFGAVLTTKIITLCTALDTYYAFGNDSGFIGAPTHSFTGVPVKGVEYWNGVHRPNLHFIREQESYKPNYVAN